MPGQFQFSKIKAGEFRFRLIAGNGDTILSSEAYTSKLGCTKGIESVRSNASNPDNFIKEPTSNGCHRFSLISLNGRVLATSPDHQTVASYNSGIATVARLARNASIEEQT